MVSYNIKEIKNLDIDFLILKYALKVRKFSFTDLQKEFGDRAGENKISSSKTLIEHVKNKLVPKRYILLKSDDPNGKRYHINPYIKTLDKDLDMQIKLGLKKKEEHDKLLEISFFKEAELRNRITNSEVSQISKDFGDLTNEVFISNKDNLFLANIFYSFFREAIIFNPGVWKKLIKPKHYNFRFLLKCNWEKDPKIFTLINELKEIYKKIGYIPHNINSPFHKDEKIKLNSKVDDEYYKSNVYEETIRDLTEKKVKNVSKNFQNKFGNLFNSFKYLSKEIEVNAPELKDLSNIFDLPLFSDKFKNPTIEERKEISEKFINSLERFKNKIFSLLEIED